MIDKNLLMPHLIDNPFVEGPLIDWDSCAFGGITCKSTAGFSPLKNYVDVCLPFVEENKPSEVELLPGIQLDSPWQKW